GGRASEATDTDIAHWSVPRLAQPPPRAVTHQRVGTKRTSGRLPMKVTPLDLRQAQFKTKMRGYDPQEVAPFLADAANELEQALREIDRLKQDLVRAETAMVEHRDRETSLRNTLLTAQRLADSIKENAET